MPVSTPTQHPVPKSVTSVDDLRLLRGAELGPTEAILIGQDRIDAFAKATEDLQWIHVDPVRAATGPFGTTIAHGYLTLSLCSAFVERLLEVSGLSMAVNYGLDRVRFPSPVRVGTELRARALVVEVAEVQGGVQATIRVTIEGVGEAKPACVADMLVRYYV
jgi:acyl dehydratase